MSESPERNRPADRAESEGKPTQTRRHYERPVLKRWGPIEEYTAGTTGGNTDAGSPAPLSTKLL